MEIAHLRDGKTRLFGLGLAIASTAFGCRSAAPPARAPATAAPVINDGRALLRAMNSRYAGKWYSSLAISLSNALYSTEGRQTQSFWREFIGVPGRQRIDYMPLEQQSGVLYVGGRIYSFVNGKLSAEQPGRNALVILVADVYAQPVDTTSAQLGSLGFDLSKVRSDVWQGDRIWIVGAGAGDTTTSQFWIDADSLLVERVIQRESRGARTIVSDVRFAAYSDAGGYPVAKQMTVYRDGRLLLRQNYSDVRVNVALPPALFDPAKFSSPPPIP